MDCPPSSLNGKATLKAIVSGGAGLHIVNQVIFRLPLRINRILGSDKAWKLLNEEE